MSELISVSMSIDRLAKVKKKIRISQLLEKAIDMDFRHGDGSGNKYRELAQRFEEDL